MTNTAQIVVDADTYIDELNKLSIERNSIHTLLSDNGYRYNVSTNYLITEAVLQNDLCYCITSEPEYIEYETKPNYPEDHIYNLSALTVSGFLISLMGYDDNDRRIFKLDNFTLNIDDLPFKNYVIRIYDVNKI